MIVSREELNLVQSEKRSRLSFLFLKLSIVFFLKINNNFTKTLKSCSPGYLVMEVIGSEGIHTAWYISTLWCNTRWLKGRWTSRGLSGFRECRRLDDTTRQDGFSGGKCPRYHASQLFNLSPASSLPLLLPPVLLLLGQVSIRAHAHTRAREPWHQRKTR